MDLNEKLAKWAGIKTETTGLEVYHPKGDSWYRDVSGKPYYPCFTDSLDACFKWLVPKLTYMSIFYDSKLGYSVSVDDGNAVMAMGEKSLALALCKAIEKLIDEESK